MIDDPAGRKNKDHRTDARARAARGRSLRYLVPEAALRYIEELSITGLTSNPTIFDKAISKGDSYDDQIVELHERGLEPEQRFFELALADLREAAGMFEPVNRRTDGVDGWVSLEVSPLLADDAEKTIEQAADVINQAELVRYQLQELPKLAGDADIAQVAASGAIINCREVPKKAHATSGRMLA